MTDREHFWRLEHLSDRQLLERLQGVLRTQRWALAELIAHLGEVEERRLHLAAAHGSLFSYCVGQLGMSEDEACRRIELARLARKFPRLFGELASGRISLSVALLLKPVLTPDNQAELFAAANGASLRTARELVAARFPSPDVPSQIRKLPERLVANAVPAAVAGVANPIPATVPDVAPAQRAVTTPGATTGATAAPTLTSWPQQPRLQESELRSLAEGCAQSVFQEPAGPAEPSHAPAQPGLPRHVDRRQRIDPLFSEATPAIAARAPASCIPRAARRAVLERDGLGCCWVDAAGNRCGSTAWLELDHHQPSGKGGCSVPENLRLLCRSHNRFAAERAYGRDHVERAIQARQRSAKRRCPGAQPL